MLHSLKSSAPQAPQAPLQTALPRDLWYGTSGPRDAKIVLVGESWGAEEARQRCPFVGASGRELDRILAEAGLSRRDILVTNMIAERPEGNDTFRFFEPKNLHPKSPRVGGLLPSPQAASEIRRLYRQLTYRPRSLVIGTGNWALWALSQRAGTEIVRESSGRRVPESLQTYTPNGIMSWRGSMVYCEPHLEFGPSPQRLSETPLLPIIHPAAILRAWYLRSPTLHDLKTRVPQALRGDWRPIPPPTTFAPPTYNEVVDKLWEWSTGPAVDLAVDIETIQRKFITCIGFADSPSFAMSIPFIAGVDGDGSFGSYWTPEQEARIVHLIRRVLVNPRIRIVGQNFIYDTQYLQHWLGITPRLDFDTMLAQNVVFPGTPKDLSYLSSLYCRHHWYWKDDLKDWSRLGDLRQLLEYNCTDALRTWEIAQRQREYIHAIGAEDQMRFKMQTNRLCLRMMNRGVLIDTARCGSMLSELQDALNSFHHELLDIIPQSMVDPEAETPWYNSPKQIQELFYNVLGMQVVNNRKTGRPTIGKEALAILERKYPEFTAIFRRLDYAGSTATTVAVIKTPVEWDGRMRCSYNPGGTETHRLSSSENVFGRGTNLQNLSKGEEDE